MKSAGKLFKAKFFPKRKHKTGWIAGNWIAFALPDEGNFNVLSILGPRWLLYFFQSDGINKTPVSLDSNGTILHANPIRLDRFGNFPTVYLRDILSYTISIRNEFNVERHLIENYRIS